MASEGSDSEGFDSEGFDSEGFDKDGYDRDGLDKFGDPSPASHAAAQTDEGIAAGIQHYLDMGETEENIRQGFLDIGVSQEDIDRGFAAVAGGSDPASHAAGADDAGIAAGIQHYLDMGETEENIRQGFLDMGVSQEDIDRGFAALAGANDPPPLDLEAMRAQPVTHGVPGASAIFNEGNRELLKAEAERLGVFEEWMANDEIAKAIQKARES